MSKRLRLVLVFLGITSLILSGVVLYSDQREDRQNPLPEKVENRSEPEITAPDGQKTYSYPISRYQERLTFRKFGRLVTEEEKPPTCGRPFSGYHNADDLEILEGEENKDVPVYAMTNATVISLTNVNGYGGLLVLRSTLDGEDVTMNYGHLNLSTASFKVGDSVRAGQQLAVLGRGCSPETDGERKHLHFAIHKGASVDVRGYLLSQQDLQNWIDPSRLLESKNAKSINK